MRVLKFIVDGQTIKQDPDCDFSGLVPGSESYIEADFSFSKEWRNVIKVAGFYSNLGKEHAPQLLKDGHTCIIPPEATKNRIFKVCVFGKSDSYNLKTNKISIDQKGG